MYHDDDNIHGTLADNESSIEIQRNGSSQDTVDDEKLHGEANY